jgi:uncharacterized protein YndB with AHSA1/START domain
MTTANDAPQGTRYTTEFTTPGDLEVTARRVFDAPRQLIWEMHTRPEHVRRWLLGPDGWSMPVCEIDLRPGGAWHYVWRNDANGREFGMRGVFHEVVPPERLVNTESWGEDWEETLATTTFTEENGRTTLVSTSRFASREAREKALATGMTSGWGASYDRLETLLAAR